MDTKLKRYNIWLKVLSIIVFVVSAAVAVTMIAELQKINEESNYYREDVHYENYYETIHFKQEVAHADGAIGNLYRLYTDKDSTLSRIAYEANEEILNIFNQETNYIYSNQVQSEGGGGHFNSYYYSNAEAEAAMNDFQNTHSAEINEIAKKYIEIERIQYIEEIDNQYNGGLVYFFTTPEGVVVTNTSFTTDEDFESEYSTISGGEVNPSYNSRAEYKFSFTEDFLNAKFIIPFEDFKESYNEVNFVLLTASLILMIPSFCYCIYAAGRRNSNQVKMLKIDKLFVDINIVLLATMAFLLLASVVLIDDGWIHYLSPLVFGIEIAIILTLFLSLVRHVKNGTFFKHTFIRKVVSRIWKFVKVPLDKLNDLIVHPSSNRKSLITVIVVSSLVMALCISQSIKIRHYYDVHEFLVIGLMLIFLIAVYLLIKHITEFEKLSEGVKKIKSGKYDEKIEVNFTTEYNEFAENLNDISSGLSDEVERRLKSERMKTDLITNVSHDLKTPLTSFITYVDLLKKEEFEDEKIQGYINVLDQKSVRLKILVDDLVDSAKASSGNVQIALDKVEVNSLISQCLGELDDSLSKSELDFKVKMPNEKLYVHADGKLLWRVVNNLIDNILKYSLPKTRVYINIFENGDDIILEFKNISADELNISEDELMDRFVRGDKSRNTKGSGLGLNIAKSLMIAQNGELSISIDGDAFKSVVKISKYHE